MNQELPREPINQVPLSVIEQSIRTAVVRLLRSGKPIRSQNLRACGARGPESEMLDLAHRIKSEIQESLYRPKLMDKKHDKPVTTDHVRAYRDAWKRIRQKKPMGSDLDQEVAEHVQQTRRGPLPGQKELPMKTESKKR